MSIFSVVIPCYNQGEYLEECLNSLWKQSFEDFEVIIVNDGSSDEFTNNFLRSFKHEKASVIHTENQGLAAARNNGIKVAKGKYILPLDADDKVSNDYLQKAIRILEDNPDVGIVYSDANLFGAEDRFWDLPKFTMEKMLHYNVIFCSGFFRKRDWQVVGGYSLNMIKGNEDWDFWLKILSLGRKVYKIPEVCFFYRVKQDSMVKGITEEILTENSLKVFYNNHSLYKTHIGRYPTVKYSQLFIDSGHGFNTEDCYYKPFWSDVKEVSFEIDLGHQLRSFRFDPVDDYLYLKNIKAYIVEKSGKQQSIEYTSTSSSINHDGGLLFQDDDPQLIFDLPQDLDATIKIVKIVFDVISYGRTAERLLNEVNDLIFESQLFYDEGSGFNEKAMIRKRSFFNDDGHYELTFDIKHISNTVEFRFDVTPNLSIIKLLEVSVTWEDGTSTLINDYSFSAFIENNGEIFFLNSDPQCTFKLPVENGKRAVNLTMSFSIISYDHQTKDSVIQLIQNRYESLNNDYAFKLGQYNEHVDSLQTEKENLQTEKENLQTEKKDLKRILDETELLLNNTQQEYSDLKQSYEEVTNSKSWKLTYPLRRFLNILKVLVR